MVHRSLLADILAAAVSFGVYILVVLVFAVVETSEYGRASAVPVGIDLSYLKLYSVYFALYVGSAVALSRPTGLWARILLGTAAAAGVLALVGAAFIAGWALGIVLFFATALVGGMSGGLVGSLLAIPIAGAAVGYGLNVLLGRLGAWPTGNPTLTGVRQMNIVLAAVCACLAAYFAYAYGMGRMPDLGRARVLQEMLAGLLGPALHVISKLALPSSGVASNQRMQWRDLRLSLPEPAYRALALWAVGAIALLAIWGSLKHGSAVSNLWTTGSVATVFASEEEVRRSRMPAPDSPIQIGTYIVDRRPAELLQGGYDWRSKRYTTATFSLGRIETTEGLVEVQVDMDALGLHGLAYLCDEPDGDKLAPCSVAKRDQTQHYDPKAIWVGLYQGEAQIGRLGRPFMMSCRYSIGICRLEFLPPWFDGVRMALSFDKKHRDQWADIVRFAIPQIESLVHRAQLNQPDNR